MSNDSDDIKKLIEQLGFDELDTEQVGGHDTPPEIQRDTVRNYVSTLRDSVGFESLGSAVEQIEARGEAAVEPLIKALHNRRWSIRNNVAMLLGDLGGARAVEPLINTFRKDKNTLVRNSAALALGKIGDARAVEPLIEGLREETPDMSQLFGSIKSDGLLGKMRVMKQVIDGSFMGVGAAAADALGQIGDARAVTPLIDALQHRDVTVRRDAAVALGKIGDARALEPLKALLSDAEASTELFTDLVQAAAREAITAIESKAGTG